MRNFFRLLVLCFSLCLMLLWLMHKLGQVMPMRGIIAFTQVDNAQDPTVLLLDVPSSTSLAISSTIGIDTLGRQPQWSNDGESLAFWAHSNRQNSSAYEMRFSDYALTNLSAIWHYFSLPLYGANGSRAFANNPMYANSPLHFVEAGASEATVLLENIIAPQFSPDGQYLAYLAFYNPTTNATLSAEEDETTGFELDLYTYDFQTGTSHNWTETLNTSGLPQWSADSRYIAFASRQRNLGVIYLLDMLTGSLAPLALETDAISPPQWSADGRYLAFVTPQWDNLEIAVLDLQLMSLQNVSSHPLYDIQPTWSPDSRLAFISHRHGQDEIYAYDLATQQLERLTFTPENEADPAWRPR